MSVTTELEVAIYESKNGKRVISFDLYEGTQEFYSVVKTKTFFQYYNLDFSDSFEKEVDSLDTYIAERQGFEISGLVTTPKLLNAHRMLSFIEDVDEYLFRLCDVFFRPRSFFDREIGKSQLEKILKEEVYNSLHSKSKESFNNYIDFHKKRLQKLTGFLKVFKMICQYANSMNHEFKLEFEIS